MCGIAGFLNTDRAPADPALLHPMADAIRHRGPDGEGFYEDGPVGFAHRRLSIIDLSSAGAQPMVTGDGRYALTYNGEVYNFVELRRELEALGRKFHSHTDSEVVLHAFAVWGISCVEKFNGMFAFSVWDSQERVLHLARDRYGIKPLYFSQRPQVFLFGSEVKALLAHPALKAQMDRKALLQYATFQNFLNTETLYEGVEILPAGCWMSVQADGTRKTHRYWDYNFADPAEPLSVEEYEEELERLFEQAVNRQLIGDVEVGSYLSGGMDSGSITAVAARSNPDLMSFTVGFDMTSASGLELAFDERAEAEHLSYLCGTEHYEVVLKAGDMERCMKKLVWHLEEPRVGQSYPNFYASRLGSRFVKVILAGSGGDEIFGGYPWRYYRAVKNNNFDDYVDKYYGFWQRMVSNSQLRNVFAPIWDDVSDVWTRDIFHDVFEHPAERLQTPEDYVNHSLYFEAKTFMHGLLVVEDKLSMAHSMETRLPFLDNDLVDFAMNIPVNLKLGNLKQVVEMDENQPGTKVHEFFNKTQDGKLILRRAMKSFLPQKVTGAVKQGFSAPDASWFRGESIDYVRDSLFNRNAPIYDFLDYKAVTALVQDHLSGTVNRRLLVWSLLYLNEWCDQFLLAKAA